MGLPSVIQGGMGVAVSGWRLARAVSVAGQLGVVSGKALSAMFTRRLQQGDPEGHLRRACAAFPDLSMAKRAWDSWYVDGGLAKNIPFKLHGMYTHRVSRELQELTVLANFCEVWLAKEGHDGVVGLNLLEKLQLPTLPSLYGAMLAGVNFVIMGAGIPLEIPGTLDNFAIHQPASLRLDVAGAEKTDDFKAFFDPRELFPVDQPPLNRPLFLPIVSSNVLASALVKRATGRVDGFVVEGPTAGGHNAPPRGPLTLNEIGEPIYGERDAVDIDKLRELNLPFWMAGSYGGPDTVERALALGAQGVQVGTMFAFCEESGMAPEVKAQLFHELTKGTVRVHTDPNASPTGFPFKVVQLAGTMSDADVYASRERLCDLGYLRRLYRKANGTIGYRCPAEPVELYVKKGGEPADCEGRKCLCNGLAAAVGLGQQRNGGEEPALVTAGDGIEYLRPLFERHGPHYTAADVLEYLLQASPVQKA